MRVGSRLCSIMWQPGQVRQVRRGFVVVCVAVASLPTEWRAIWATEEKVARVWAYHTDTHIHGHENSARQRFAHQYHHAHVQHYYTHTHTNKQYVLRCARVTTKTETGRKLHVRKRVHVVVVVVVSSDARSRVPMLSPFVRARDADREDISHKQTVVARLADQHMHKHTQSA